MKREEIRSVLQKQRDYFASGATLPLSVRRAALEKLKRAVKTREHAIAGALQKDLGKGSSESYLCEIGMVLSELSYMEKHLASFAKKQPVKTPMALFPAKSYTKPSPYGVVLIMSPWNYPFLLTMGPLINALAAGNTAILKPSAYSPATSRLIGELIQAVFPAEYVAVVPGGREENALLLEEKFDYIFFTGSKAVGSLVLEKAAPHLTPVTLELGGKSPCIVDKSADLPSAARRIVFGKFLNCGQTCVAPDYILCHHEVKQQLLDLLKKEIRAQFPNALTASDYGHIVNEKHLERLIRLIDQKKVVIGGAYDREKRKIEPTVMDSVTWQDPIMQEEIFGPVLPVLTFDRVSEVIAAVNSREKPLAFYVFAENKKVSRELLSRCAFGGGCVNDTIVHLATSEMGFGGVGESGMGSYHGRAGFETFSHRKSIVQQKNWLDVPLRYRPYSRQKEKLLRLFLK